MIARLHPRGLRSLSETRDFCSMVAVLMFRGILRSNGFFFVFMIDFVTIIVMDVSIFLEVFLFIVTFFNIS